MNQILNHWLSTNPAQVPSPDIAWSSHSLQRCRLSHGLIAVVLGMTVAVASEAAPIVKAETFDGEFANVEKRNPNSPSTVTGQLPEKWIEDSSYAGCDAGVRYARVAGVGGTGGALRITVSNLIKGNAQTLLPGIQLDTKSDLRVRFFNRSDNYSGVRVGVRKGGAPYTMYASEIVRPSMEWGASEIIVPAQVDDAAAQLILIFERPGEVDLDDLSITRLPVETNQQAIPPNLLSSGSFPDGVARPWLTYGDPTKARADATVTGPSGLPTLRLEPSLLAHRAAEPNPYQWGLMVPFQVPAAGTYTFSAAVCAGDKPMAAALKVRDLQGRDIGVKRINVTTAWNRFELPLQLEPRRTYTARIEYGGFWHGPSASFVNVDQVRLGPGSAGDYVSPTAVELSATSSRDFGLFLEGQPFQVQAAAWGAMPAGATLHGTLFDAFGKQLELPATALPQGKGLQRVALEIPASTGLGFFSLQLTAKDASGATLSAPRELVLARIRSPRKAEEFAPDSPFGIHCNVSEEYVRLARDLGFKWMRAHDTGAFNWAQLQGTENWPWDFSRTDAVVERWRRYKFNILGILGGTPRWVTGNSDTPGTFATQGVVPPEKMHLFTDYAQRIAERYKSQVQQWESWNEPDWPSFLNKDKNKNPDPKGDANPAVRDWVHATPEEYVAMNRAGYEGIKQGNPQAKILINIASLGNQRNLAWFKAAIAAGLTDHTDGATYHAYAPSLIGLPGDLVERNLNTYRSILPTHLHASIFDSEGGPGRGFFHGVYRNQLPRAEPGEIERWADYGARRYIAALARKQPKFYLYAMERGGYVGGHGNYDVMGADGSLSPLLVGVSNLAWHLEGTQHVGNETLGDDLHLSLFSGDGRSVMTILTTALGRRVAQPPAGIAIRDVFGNAITLPGTLPQSTVFVSSESDAPDVLLAKTRAWLETEVGK